MPYETPEGVVDFHALRAAYITYLVNSGASVKTCQTLARQSSPTLTVGIDAKASLHDVRGAVEDLPDLTRPAPDVEPAALAATGTEGAHKHTRGPSCIHSEHGPVRSGAARCVITGSDDQGSMEEKSLENKAPDGSVRLGTAQAAEGVPPLPNGPVCSNNTLGNHAHRVIGPNCSYQPEFVSWDAVISPRGAAGRDRVGEGSRKEARYDSSEPR